MIIKKQKQEIILKNNNLTNIKKTNKCKVNSKLKNVISTFNINNNNIIILNITENSYIIKENNIVKFKRNNLSVLNKKNFFFSNKINIKKKN